MARGWAPVGCNGAGVEMWEPPNKGWSHVDKEVLIPNLPKNQDKPQQKFTRRVIKGPATMPCTTMQALYAEKQKVA